MTQDVLSTGHPRECALAKDSSHSRSSRVFFLCRGVCQIPCACIQVYRAWQQRRAERGSSGGRSRGAGAAEADPPQTAPAVAIPNATDAFYTRLTAALEASTPFSPEYVGFWDSAPTGGVKGLSQEFNERKFWLWICQQVETPRSLEETFARMISPLACSLSASGTVTIYWWFSYV